MAPWKLPLIVAAISVPIIAGFFVGGGGVGLAAGALVAVAIVVIAARQRPQGPIGSAPAPDTRRHVLLVTTCAVEEPVAVAEIARAGDLDGETDDVDVRVLAPARIRFLDRWASDVEPARQAAQENLVATVAALAKAGIEAEARVGDEDLVQAVEDQLQTFPATEVVLVSAAGEDQVDDAAVGELDRRLAARFRHVVLNRGAA
jgi:hypothetical protein